MDSYTKRAAVAPSAHSPKAITAGYRFRASFCCISLASALVGCASSQLPPRPADAQYYWPGASNPYSPLVTWPSTTPLASPTAPPTDVSDAPQDLLLRYLKLRKIGGNSANSLRDKELLTELLNLYEPQAWRDTLRNEISRPMALNNLKRRLDGEEPKRRLLLGMWVQLLDYNVTSQAFHILYPLRFDNDQPRYDNQYYPTITYAESGIPESNYTNLRTPCVTSRRDGNLRPDTYTGYFVVKLECIQHSSQSLSENRPPEEPSEIPATAALRFPMGDLWKSLPVPIERANSFIDKFRNRSRYAWAELVFDVVQMRVKSFGPFRYNSRPPVIYQDPVVVTIKPQALFVWENSSFPHKTRGPLIAAIGNVPKFLPESFIRITDNMIASPIAPHRADTYASGSPPADRIQEDSSPYTNHPISRRPVPDIPVPSPASKPAIRQPLRPSPLPTIPTGQ